MRQISLFWSRVSFSNVNLFEFEVHKLLKFTYKEREINNLRDKSNLILRLLRLHGLI